MWSTPVRPGSELATVVLPNQMNTMDRIQKAYLNDPEGNKELR